MRLKDLTSEQQQDLVVAMLKAGVEKAVEMGLDGVPAVLFVLGPNPPLMISTLPPSQVEEALDYIRGLEIMSISDRSKEMKHE
jgi:hypothetical protein